MGRRAAARDHGRSRRLHGKHFQIRELGLEYLGHARQVAARAYAGDQHVQPIGEVRQNFLGRGGFVDVYVGGVFKLLGNPCAGSLCRQFLRAGDGALHAFFLGGQIKRSAIGQHQAAALDGHALWHDQNQLVALDCCDQGQTHAGIAAGGLNDDAAGFECAGFFCRFHHGQCNAVLDGATGVAALRLDPHIGIAAEDAVHADDGRVANRL